MLNSVFFWNSLRIVSYKKTPSKHPFDYPEAGNQSDSLEQYFRAKCYVKTLRRNTCFVFIVIACKHKVTYVFLKFSVLKLDFSFPFLLLISIICLIILLHISLKFLLGRRLEDEDHLNIESWIVFRLCMSHNFLLLGVAGYVMLQSENKAAKLSTDFRGLLINLLNYVINSRGMWPDVVVYKNKLTLVHFAI